MFINDVAMTRSYFIRVHKSNKDITFFNKKVYQIIFLIYDFTIFFQQFKVDMANSLKYAFRRHFLIDPYKNVRIHFPLLSCEFAIAKLSR